MSLTGMISAAAAVQQLSPPAATLSDQLFAYGALLLLIGLVVWQEWTAPNPKTED